MTRFRATQRLLVAATIAVVLAACSTPVPNAAPTRVPSSTPTPTPIITPSGDGVLKVGTLLPTSGTFSFLAAAQAAGVAAAVTEINAAGGVNGEDVVVVGADSGEA